MIDFLKLGRYSAISMTQCDETTYCVYSHCVCERIQLVPEDDEEDTPTNDIQAYGWEFRNKKDALKNMCEVDDALTIIRPDDEDDDVEYKIIKKTKIPPLIYVGFEYKYIKLILRNHISICYDYMDQGFSEIGYGDPEYKAKNFFNDDGMAAMFVGEGLWIAENDYTQIEKLYRKN